MNNPAFAKRLTQAFISAGYVRPNGKPNVQKWVKDKNGYVPTPLYRYLKGQEPGYAELTKLAKDLGVTVEWLVTGAERKREDRALNAG